MENLNNMEEADRNHRLQAWEALNGNARFQVKYPHERVVSWTFRNFDRVRAGDFRLLDLGCGAGRHALFWLREGYRAAATDIAGSAIRETLARAERESFRLDAMVAGADAIPFPDASMDGLLSFGVLYYLSEAEMQAAFDEIQRVLKPGGRALIVTRGQDDDRCRRAAPIGGSMYRLGSLGEGAPSEAEADMVMTFVDRTDIERLARGFASVSVDTMHFSEGNGAFMNADWYIQLVR